jgi:signal transduction histidine kinase
MMQNPSPPLPGSATPSYEEELDTAQRASMRMACLIAAALVVAFSLLDRYFSPSGWLWLLGVRAASAVVLCALGLLGSRLPPIAVATAGVAVITATIDAAMIHLGREDPYLFSVMLVQAGVTILLPLLPTQALWLNVETIAIALLPLGRKLGGPSLPAATFLFSMALVCVGGAAVHDRMRRREQKARAELARNMGLLNLGTLAAGLAHELSEPIQAMARQLDLLDKAEIPPPARMAMLRRHVDRLTNILEAMRNGARIADGGKRPVDLAHEADLAFLLLESKLRSTASFVRAYADVPKVMAQPTLLGQVLVNLLSNAADAVAGLPEPRIALRVRKHGGDACVEVEDNGPGIPDDLREKVFEPFFSTKGEKGNGMGLWISSEIARLHGGKLTAERGGAGGALLRLALPIPDEPLA